MFKPSKDDKGCKYISIKISENRKCNIEIFFDNKIPQMMLHNIYQLPSESMHLSPMQSPTKCLLAVQLQLLEQNLYAQKAITNILQFIFQDFSDASTNIDANKITNIDDNKVNDMPLNINTTATINNNNTTTTMNNSNGSQQEQQYMNNSESDIDVYMDSNAIMPSIYDTIDNESNGNRNINIFDDFPILPNDFFPFSSLPPTSMNSFNVNSSLELPVNSNNNTNINTNNVPQTQMNSDPLTFLPNTNQTNISIDSDGNGSSSTCSSCSCSCCTNSISDNGKNTESEAEENVCSENDGVENKAKKKNEIEPVRRSTRKKHLSSRYQFGLWNSRRHSSSNGNTVIVNGTVFNISNNYTGEIESESSNSNDYAEQDNGEWVVDYIISKAIRKKVHRKVLGRKRRQSTNFENGKREIFYLVKWKTDEWTWEPPLNLLNSNRRIVEFEKISYAKCHKHGRNLEVWNCPKHYQSTFINHKEQVQISSELLMNYPTKMKDILGCVV